MSISSVSSLISTHQKIIASQNSSGMSTDYSTMVLNMYKNFQSLHDQAFL